jgi:hypothetical protein
VSANICLKKIEIVGPNSQGLLNGTKYFYCFKQGDRVKVSYNIFSLHGVPIWKCKLRAKIIIHHFIVTD